MIGLCLCELGALTSNIGVYNFQFWTSYSRIRGLYLCK